MIIRKAVNEDIPELIRLLHQANYVHSSKRPDIFKRNITKYTPEQIEGIIANEDAPIFVAQKEDRKGEPILGYVFLQIGEFKDDEKMSDRKYAYYDDVCVDAEARRMGVGKALMQYAEDYAKECGCYNIELHVWELNPGALEFYNDFGMVPQYTSMEKVLK